MNDTPRLSLLVLRARNLEPTLAFYRSLGLTFVEEKHGAGPVHYSCTLGATVLEVYPGRDEKEPERRAPGAMMIGFAVASLEVALDAVRAHGAKIVTAPRARRAVVEDPDGRTVELTELVANG